MHLFERAVEELQTVDEESATAILPEVNAYADAVWAESFDEGASAIGIDIDRETLEQIIVVAFAMGQLAAQDADDIPEILLGVEPDEASAIITGLFGSGVRLVLGVVRPNN